MMHPLGGDEIKGDWASKIGPAAILWGKLSEAELRALDGSPERLADLIQKRYAISPAEAGKQVRTFFLKYTA